MDQAIRNKLRNVVTQCRKLLEESVRLYLQGRFGIYAAKKNDIQVDDDARMTHLETDELASRKDILDHLSHITARGLNPKAGLDQLVREIAFTHLNRLCAYKMMEARKVHVGGRKFREAVSRGLKSQGFLFFLADHPEYEQLYMNGKQDIAYRKFLDWLGETLSEEIGVLFNPSDPANRIYPPQRVLDEVLALINADELNDIWTEDETIGWVYQYFTPKELRDKARKESQAPRNSYELAFRNQFFTPRYVVEFLTDNTLGRIWYDMRKGDTSLTGRCRYLVRRPTEIFLKEGEEPPAESNDTREDLSQEELLNQPVIIPHRPKKDPRGIKILDPACGSGHFLIYCFDLLQVVYEEAYDDAELSKALKQDHPDPDDFRREVPSLILKHNLHGIDIDLRATQIAALALWLRCQRAYQEMGLTDGQRPKIRRSNIVCAEPMPGETDILKEFTATLQPKVLGQLVEVVFEKMKLAGETGSLLKIEEEIRDAAITAKTEYQNELRLQEEQDGYLPGTAPPREPALFDFSDMTDSEFLDRAEEEIVMALRQYTDKALNDSGFRRRLFAEDAARGFSFVDVCRKKFDVALMNPPFGRTVATVSDYLESSYPETKNDLYAAFVERTLEMLLDQGMVGVITSRTGFFLSSLASFRSLVTRTSTLRCMADLGQGVLDSAMVKTASYVIEKGQDVDFISVYFMLLNLEDKQTAILEAVQSLGNCKIAFFSTLRAFLSLPGNPFAYWMPTRFRELARSFQPFEADGREVRQGLASSDDFRFVRAWWEVSPAHVGRNKRWVPFAKGGESTAFFADVHLLIDWKDEGKSIKELAASKWGSASRTIKSTDRYFCRGLTYTSYTNGFRPRVLPDGCIFSVAGMHIHSPSENLWYVLGILSSNVTKAFLSLITDGRKFEAGYVKRVPFISAIHEQANRYKDTVSSLAMEACQATRQLLSSQENSHDFCYPSIFPNACNGIGQGYAQQTQILQMADRSLKNSTDQLDQLICRIYGVEPKEIIECLAISTQTATDTLSETDMHDDEESPDLISSSVADDLVSWLIGVCCGRWDLRLLLDQSLTPKRADPFGTIPISSLGMLVGPTGLPSEKDLIVSENWLQVRSDANTLPPEGSVVNPTIPDERYPLRISRDGILADDPGHEDDVVKRVRNVLEVIWKDSAEAIEKEVCEILGVRKLRDYFRKPGNGGFWMDHVKRYSKSRRKAPIYWYLRSAKGNYGLWLYYHRLDKDILFKALLNHVEPKIRMADERLKEFRVKKQAAGSAGNEAKQIEKDMDRQEQFVSELQDFSDKLSRAADLHLDPDLNDGVVLNIAPLRELVPWKEAKKYWEELLDGKYEWSSIGKQLREKGLVK